VLLDVGVDVVELAEGALPGDGAGAPGDQKSAVDVEEGRGGQCSPSSRSRWLRV
jgi:hypothetical protein